MPLTFAHLKKNTRTLKFTYDGEPVSVTYKPGEVTPSLGQEMAGDKNPLVKTLAKVLTGWDVLDDDTMLPLPITEETLSELPTVFLNTILTAIYEDSVPGKVLSATSGAGC